MHYLYIYLKNNPVHVYSELSSTEFNEEYSHVMVYRTATLISLSVSIKPDNPSLFFDQHAVRNTVKENTIHSSQLTFSSNN